MCGQVTQSRPFTLFLPGNWTLNTGTQGWKIYPNKGSLKESLINCCYPDSSGVLIPSSGAHHGRFCTLSEPSHVIPISSLKGQFLLQATQEPCLVQEGSWGMWNGRQKKWPISGDEHVLSSTSQELCSAWLKGKLQGRKCEESGWREIWGRVGESWTACLQSVGFLLAQFPTMWLETSLGRSQ